MMCSDLLSEFDNIKHGFCYNHEHGTYDEYCVSIENQLGKIFFPKLVHGDDVYVLDNYNSVSNVIEADAVITNLKNIAIGVKTADCLPILIYCDDIKYVAAIHSGWKSTIKNIVTKTIDRLINFGANVDNMYVVIGPAIAQDSYEVSDDFYINFKKNIPESVECFKHNNDKLYFDLSGLVLNQIKSCGVKMINFLNIDTFTSTNFPSYRGYCMNNVVRDGNFHRFISFVGLK